MSFDVAVVGAGAAGAATAYQLALRGRSVVLIDERALPRSKPCGGGMAASVQQWFPCDLTPAVDRVIDRVRFTWCLEDPVIADLPGAPFWIVRRDRLDWYLAEQALQAGAELVQGARVDHIQRLNDGWELEVDEGGKRYGLRAHKLVLAHGSGAGFARQLGVGNPRPRYAAAMSLEVQAEVKEPSTNWFEFGLVEHGFCWTFPRRDSYSIGIGTFIGRLPTNYDDVLAKILPHLNLPLNAGERKLCSLAVWNGHHRLHQPGVVAVGDAASLADPFLAEGIRPALLSGVRAAEAIDRDLGGDQGALANYSKAMRAEWGESMNWGRRISQIFYRVPKLGYQLGIKRSTAPQRIAQILSGEMGYGDIALRVIKRLTPNPFRS